MVMLALSLPLSVAPPAVTCRFPRLSLTVAVMDGLGRASAMLMPDTEYWPLRVSVRLVGALTTGLPLVRLTAMVLEALLAPPI